MPKPSSIKSESAGFALQSTFSPAGDQPQAIEKLVQGLDAGQAWQTLLGVTGSGKTFTMAHVIQQIQRPAIVMAPNKILAAQLYGEFREMFPKNAVEYFVSYYDYYQPEAYVVASDTYIEKDSSINEHIEQMRLSATKALIERLDVIVVATVSSIYGLGDPKLYLRMMLHLVLGDHITQRKVLRRLTELQYRRNDVNFSRSCFRVRGGVIDIYPAESERHAVRVELFDDEVEKLSLFDPLTGKVVKQLRRVSIYPKSHYVTPRETVLNAVDQIEVELLERLEYFRDNEQFLEEQRIKQRCSYDIEMLRELGYCTGIENYSRYLSGREQGMPPPTLFDYMPPSTLIIVDESHVTIPQIRAMYKGDHSRKKNLVEYGFRLPSALDNRPLRFDEWEQLMRQVVFVSATPSDYEAQQSQQVVEQLIRPTGIVDPLVVVRPVTVQVDDIIGEAKKLAVLNQRVLITVLTKKMAEDVTDYLSDNGIRVRYMHSDIDTVERVEIIRDLRLGAFDVLVGINLLREGLDLPEVALVAIFDADKEGFLRSERSLIQTIGRAARNIDGRVILYADTITGSIRKAIDETDRRRQKQQKFNQLKGIVPQALNKSVIDIMDGRNLEVPKAMVIADSQSVYSLSKMNPEALAKHIDSLYEKMLEHARNLEFEQATVLRDNIDKLKKKLIFQL